MRRFVVVLVASVVGLGVVAPAGAGGAVAEIEAAVQADPGAGFFVRFAGTADLSAAARIEGWTGRGAAVVAGLKAEADRSQAEARRRLDRAGVRYRSFWAANTLLVEGGTTTAAMLAGLAGVDRITAPRTYRPAVAASGSGVEAIGWGVISMRATEVWADFGATGQGAVVATIDTGVDWTHPALRRQYRGAEPIPHHDHNWFDPTNTCWIAPCDDHGHGTHTTGTMVGDDLAGNQIGVAPGARWIAAKGCVGSSCADATLLAAAQWVFAPTDRTGNNPRPDLRPHVVVTSGWGGADDPWFGQIIAGWRAAGIFPSVAMTGSGPGCGAVNGPAAYPESYASNAHDINGAIAPFSVRGPAGAEIKPNVTAPGLRIRSALPDHNYGTFDGTTMASAHTAGAVALLLSAAPSLIGDVDRTAALLDDGATDRPDLTCGGTPDDNNTWGEGKLDVYAAVEQSPREAG